MKVTRKGVFETNSSSVHSLSITSNKDEWKGKDSVLYVSLGEYGWGYDRLITPSEKVSYLMTLIASYVGYYGDNEFTDEDFFDLSSIKDIYKAVKHHGSEIVFNKCSKGYGYVDHQSIVPMEEFLDGIDLEDFIFNYKYEIIIDNDNH